MDVDLTGVNPDDIADPDDEPRLGADIEAKATRLYELREKKDVTKAAATAAFKEYQAFEQEFFAAVDNSPFVGSIPLDLGKFGRVTFGNRETTYARILDKQKLRQHFIDKGILEQYADDNNVLIKQRLNDLVRENNESNTPHPPGLDFYINRGVTISQERADAQGVEVEEDSDE